VPSFPGPMFRHPGPGEGHEDVGSPTAWDRDRDRELLSEADGSH
jgi:hypothetical protein